jgi:dTDP-4-dehydrorhamnose reductase
MLGSAIVSHLQQSQQKIFYTTRNKTSDTSDSCLRFDFEIDDLALWFKDKPKFDYLINCIGAIPQKYDMSQKSGVASMIELNSFLPESLNRLSVHHGYKVIQIATDCVYSGRRGKYVEDSDHDAAEIYGVSKSLGEKHSPLAMILRCSIIGKHDGGNVSLHNWLLSSKKHSVISGYKNHFWNGITTVAFARIVRSIIENDLFKSGTQHVVPADEVSKHELLEIIATVNERNDFEILPIDHEMTIDRTLGTLNHAHNKLLWVSSGYDHIPSITELVIEMDT